MSKIKYKNKPQIVMNKFDHKYFKNISSFQTYKDDFLRNHASQPDHISADEFFNYIVNEHYKEQGSQGTLGMIRNLAAGIFLTAILSHMGCQTVEQKPEETKVEQRIVQEKPVVYDKNEILKNKPIKPVVKPENIDDKIKKIKPNPKPEYNPEPKKSDYKEINKTVNNDKTVNNEIKKEYENNKPDYKQSENKNNTVKTKPEISLENKLQNEFYQIIQKNQKRFYKVFDEDWNINKEKTEKKNKEFAKYLADKKIKIQDIKKLLDSKILDDFQGEDIKLIVDKNISVEDLIEISSIKDKYGYLFSYGGDEEFSKTKVVSVIKYGDFNGFVKVLKNKTLRDFIISEDKSYMRKIRTEFIDNYGSVKKWEDVENIESFFKYFQSTKKFNSYIFKNKLLLKINDLVKSGISIHNYKKLDQLGLGISDIKLLYSVEKDIGKLLQKKDQLKELKISNFWLYFKKDLKDTNNIKMIDYYSVLDNNSFDTGLFFKGYKFESPIKKLIEKNITHEYLNSFLNIKNKEGKAFNTKSIYTILTSNILKDSFFNNENLEKTKEMFQKAAQLKTSDGKYIFISRGVPSQEKLANYYLPQLINMGAKAEKIQKDINTISKNEKLNTYDTFKKAFIANLWDINLENMYKLRNDKDYVKSLDTEKPNCLRFMPTSDFNGAFHEISRLGSDYVDSAIKQIQRKQDYFIYIASSENDVYQVIKNVAKTVGIDTLIPGGHGSQKSINLNYNTFKSAEKDEDKITPDDTEIKDVLKLLNPGVVIYLESCSNGEGGKGADNMANFFIQNADGRTVYASLEKFSPFMTVMKFDDKGYVIGLKIMKEGRDITYTNKK